MFVIKHKLLKKSERFLCVVVLKTLVLSTCLTHSTVEYTPYTGSRNVSIRYVISNPRHGVVLSGTQQTMSKDEIPTKRLKGTTTEVEEKESEKRDVPSILNEYSSFIYHDVRKEAQLLREAMYRC